MQLSSGYCWMRLRAAEERVGSSYLTLCMIGTRSFARFDASPLLCRRGHKSLQGPNLGEIEATAPYPSVDALPIGMSHLHEIHDIRICERIPA